MRITVNGPLSSSDEFYICAVDADIEINFDLTSTANKITIIGKNVIIDATVTASGNVMAVGLENTRTTARSQLISLGADVCLGKATFPDPSFTQGVHISPNLEGRVTIA